MLQTLIDVFRADLTGMHAQTLVRLIARMIKERKFQVHPNVLSAFLQLRLRKELDGMRDGKKHRGGGKGRPGQDVAEKKFKSEIRKKWATKNQKKREKEMKEVEAEMAEAEAEVDKEERAQVVSDISTRRESLSCVDRIGPKELIGSHSKPKPSRTSLCCTSPSSSIPAGLPSSPRHCRAYPTLRISSTSTSSATF